MQEKILFKNSADDSRLDHCELRILAREELRAQGCKARKLYDRKRQKTTLNFPNRFWIGEIL